MAAAPVIAIGAALIGTAVSVYGSIQQSNAMSAAAAENAAIADRNAKIADQDRILAARTAQIAAEDKRRENRRILAGIRAAYGSSGFELAGSPLDVLADTSIEMALDERRIEYEGQVRNREGALQMLYLQDEARQQRSASRDYRRSGLTAGLAQGLSGASSAAAMGAQFYG